MANLKDAFRFKNYNNGFEDKGRRNVLVGEILSRVKLEQINPVIPEVKDIIARHHGLTAEVKVIGSVANRMATFESDTDLLVVLPEDTKPYVTTAVYYDVQGNGIRLFPKASRVHLVMGVKADNEDGYTIWG